MGYPYKSAKEFTNAARGHFKPGTTAGALGIDDAHISRAYRDDYTPTYINRLIELEFIPPPRKRTRICFDVTPEDKATFQEWLRARGIKPGQWMKAMIRSMK